ncbi:hypothetical protein SAMN04490220_0626 [Rhodococcus jostii]|uniref:Uncharacterized protein n=1 Tax=Rhodococcus jostii TaxID=132919 RepID=A0A1H4IXM2_RHOJO|nr:hypothetical protein SAMN04490220_0626 [Rhodococcus jostii]
MDGMVGVHLRKTMRQMVGGDSCALPSTIDCETVPTALQINMGHRASIRPGLRMRQTVARRNTLATMSGIEPHGDRNRRRRASSRPRSKRYI